MFWLINFYLFFSQSLHARSLKATADKLAQETNHIGLGVALFGLGLAGIYFMLGKQDASTKMTQALMGVLILVLSPSIINFIKGLA
ncbi:MAG: hypothetical protein CME65_10275 [Halobacteriovoraceae bacterium]|nr:hypothetical protein [Halobacteriovoraceae bacterium]|tara:strand:- start:10356 stop:10613 length:258 start_codon:yes stop_codon:yes gene_type:complete